MPGTWVQAILRAGVASGLAVGGAVLLAHPPELSDLPGVSNAADCYRSSSGAEGMNPLSVRYCEEHHDDGEPGTVTVWAPSGTVRIGGPDGVHVDPPFAGVPTGGLLRFSVSVDPGAEGTVSVVWQDGSGGARAWDTFLVVRKGDGWAFEIPE